MRSCGGAAVVGRSAEARILSEMHEFFLFQRTNSNKKCVENYASIQVFSGFNPNPEFLLMEMFAKWSVSRIVLVGYVMLLRHSTSPATNSYILVLIEENSLISIKNCMNLQKSSNIFLLVTPMYKSFTKLQ